MLPRSDLGTDPGGAWRVDSEALAGDLPIVSKFEQAMGEKTASLPTSALGLTDL